MFHWVLCRVQFVLVGDVRCLRLRRGDLYAFDMSFWSVAVFAHTLEMQLEMHQKVAEMHHTVRDRTDERGSKMRNIAMKSVGIAAAIGAISLGAAAPAMASDTVLGSAQQTINRLQSEGYRVIVNKVGNGSLDRCSVKSVRPGQSVTEVQRLPRSAQEVVKYRTVHVDVGCTR